ncbi:MAG: GNAT family N-acetyltransferase [Roseiflexaceae bacterium]
MLILVEPALAYKDSCLDAVREFHAAGEYDVDAEQLAAQFEDLICRLAAAKDPATAPPGELPYEDFWLMDGLEKARERGLHRVLLTCDETNIGSRKIIEANGGQLENAVVVAGQAVQKLRYWISLDQR